MSIKEKRLNFFKNNGVKFTWLYYYPKFLDGRITQTFSEALADNNYRLLLFKVLYHIKEIRGYVKFKQAMIELRTHADIESGAFSISQLIDELKDLSSIEKQDQVVQEQIIHKLILIGYISIDNLISN